MDLFHSPFFMSTKERPTLLGSLIRLEVVRTKPNVDVLKIKLT